MVLVSPGEDTYHSCWTTCFQRKTRRQWYGDVLHFKGAVFIKFHVHFANHGPRCQGYFRELYRKRAALAFSLSEESLEIILRHFSIELPSGDSDTFQLLPNVGRAFRRADNEEDRSDVSRRDYHMTNIWERHTSDLGFLVREIVRGAEKVERKPANIGIFRLDVTEHG